VAFEVHGPAVAANGILLDRRLAVGGPFVGSVSLHITDPRPPRWRPLARPCRPYLRSATAIPLGAPQMAEVGRLPSALPGFGPAGQGRGFGPSTSHPLPLFGRWSRGRPSRGCLHAWEAGLGSRSSGSSLGGPPKATGRRLVLRVAIVPADQMGRGWAAGGRRGSRARHTNIVGPGQASACCRNMLGLLPPVAWAFPVLVCCAFESDSSSFVVETWCFGFRAVSRWCYRGHLPGLVAPAARRQMRLTAQALVCTDWPAEFRRPTERLEPAAQGAFG